MLMMFLLESILLQNEMKHLHRENESLAAKLGNIEAGSLASKVKDVNGIPVLVANVQEYRYE